MTTKTITKTITLCDGCGKDLTGDFQHTYRLNLETTSWSEYHNEKHQNVVKMLARVGAAELQRCGAMFFPSPDREVL